MLPITSFWTLFAITSTAAMLPARFGPSPRFWLFRELSSKTFHRRTDSITSSKPLLNQILCQMAVLFNLALPQLLTIQQQQRPLYDVLFYIHQRIAQHTHLFNCNTTLSYWVRIPKCRLSIISAALTPPWSQCQYSFPASYVSPTVDMARQKPYVLAKLSNVSTGPKECMNYCSFKIIFFPSVHSLLSSKFCTG